jgi:predicted transcriptional regulator
LSRGLWSSAIGVNAKKRNKPHRSRYEIVGEILRVVLLRNQSPSSIYVCKPLHIEYGAGLTYKQTLFYTTALVESGFLLKKKATKADPYHWYEITDKGRHYLQLFSELEDDLRSIQTKE